jgi:hypothetical protein
MKTRSQTKQVDIDFDEASNAWMANKIRRGHSMAYRCQAITKNGTQCTRPAISIIHTSESPVCCTSHTKYGKPTQFAPWSSLGDSVGAESAGSPS